MVGAGLLWVGWYGFNAGSAIGSDGVASNAFGIHGVAGTLGMLLTGLLADAAVNPNLLGSAARANGLARLVGHGLWIEQLKAMGVTFAVAVIGTTVAAYLVKAIMPVRISPEEEHSGMDLAEHGEEGYIL